MTHAWCLDPARDKAVRASEDAAAADRPTLPDHRELPAAVEHLRSIVNGHLNDFAELLGVVGRINERVGRIEAIIQNKGNDMATNGLRTELEPSVARVTLEFSGRLRTPPSQWPWDLILSGACLVRSEPGESVRVVDTHAQAVADSVAWEGARDAYRGRIARLTDERDAAVRERNEAIRDLRSVTAERAKLEEQLESVADRAAAAETALEAAPAASEWRILGKDEYPKIGDQYKHDDGRWSLIRDTNIHLFTRPRRHKFRRRLPVPAASVVPSVVRDMTDIIRGNATEDEKHSALATLVEAVCPGWRLAPAASGNGQAILDGSPAASGAAGNSPGSPVSSEPVAWMCEFTDYISFYESRTQAESCVQGDVVPQPLYRTPPQAASGAAGTDVAEIARLAFDAGFGSSREGFNGECSYDHLAPKESTFEGDGSEPYEKLKRESVAKIMSEAASGAAGTEARAWCVMSSADPPHRVGLHWDQRCADWWARVKQSEYTKKLVVVPLYAAPQAAKGWLTEKDREWLTYLLENVPISFAADEWIHSFLARSSPPEVVLPRQPSCPWGRDRRSWDDACLAMQREYDSALAAAGVTVKQSN